MHVWTCQSQGISHIGVYFFLCFFLTARKSNMADFVSGKQLIRQDVKVLTCAIAVLIKWSKTNQFGRGLLKVPLVAIPASVLCPVEAYKTIFREVPAASRPRICNMDWQWQIKVIALQAVAGENQSPFWENGARHRPLRFTQF